MTRIAAEIAPSFPAATRPAAGDRVRVAHGVFGRVGRVHSTPPGHVVVQYDCGGREIIDLTRRSIWIVE